MNPYIDEENIRTIFCDVVDSELVWHRDIEERVITVLKGEGWSLQYNGSIPVELVEGKHYRIPSHMYHRVIKGCTDLVIEIENAN